MGCRLPNVPQNYREVVVDGKRLETLLLSLSANAPTIVMLHEGLGSVAMWKDFPAQLAQATGLAQVNVDFRDLFTVHLYSSSQGIRASVESYSIKRLESLVGFDRQGGSGDAAQVKMVLAMLEAGYADRLLFSSDFSLGGSQLKRNGGPGYAKTVTVFAPKLRDAGVGEDVLHGILTDNPRRLLAFVPRP